VSIPRKIESQKYYHSYSRGVNKMNIFLDHSDYLFFQLLIKNFNLNTKIRLTCPGREKGETLVEISCYTLMPNHFHFIIKELTKNGISLFFQKILSRYSRYFNDKYTRRGPLFESRFKDKPIETDEYFEHLRTYILNNPVKLVRKDYVSKDLLNGLIELTPENKIFVRKYPYKYFA